MKKTFFLMLLSLQLGLSPLGVASGLNPTELSHIKSRAHLESQGAFPNPSRFINAFSDLVQQSPSNRSLSKMLQQLHLFAREENISLTNDYDKNLALLFQAGILSSEELLEARNLRSSLEKINWKAHWTFSGAYFESLKQTQFASIGIILPTAGFVLLAIWALSTAQELRAKNPPKIDCPDERTHIFQNQCVPNDVGMPDETNPMFF